MSTTQNICEHIRAFVMATFPLARKRGVTDEESLLENGIVDSMGVLELVNFLENRFGVRVSDEELVPENFASIERMAGFVGTKSGAAASSAPNGQHTA